MLQLRALVGVQHLADIGARVVRFKGEGTDRHAAVYAGDLKLGVEAQKGVASPFFSARHRFQQVAVAGYVFEDAQHLDGRLAVGHHLGTHGDHPVCPRRGKRLDLIKTGFYHDLPPSDNKKVLDRFKDLSRTNK
ncbi:hypothetical protein SDC9_169793 [bioreactor metagenome]|uniref:Uncharacterized protein n=1 Tax=bioreactor metagenome TaxID=1076179 RepID=A0A645G8T1_9ZZZZ